MTDPSQYFKGRTVQEQMNEVIGYVDVRSAEVATDAIAADVAQVHQDMLDADADAAAAAASAAAAAGTLANAVKKTGEASQSIEGDVLLTTGDLGVAGDLGVIGNLGVTGSATVPTPVNNTDAANKKYVDDQDALDVHLAGNQTVADVKTFSSSPVVPTEPTGNFSTKAANSDKVQNELDNYAPMLRTTGNQNSSGNKTHSGELTIVGAALWQPRFCLKTNNFNRSSPPASTVYGQAVTWIDTNNEEVARIYTQQLSNGKFELFAAVKDENNNYQSVKLI